MAFHLIVTCVSKKSVKPAHSILDLPAASGEAGQVFEGWRSMLEASRLKPVPAKDLYKSPLWKAFMECWGLVSQASLSPRLWVLSAGYGLISADEKIKPYDITRESLVYHFFFLAQKRCRVIEPKLLL